MVAVVRGWLDDAGITVRGLHAALTLDHFADKTVPDERRLRERLAGVGLTWDTVEAVADVCFADESQATTGRRLDEVQALWRASQERPTVIGADGEPAVPAREVLQAQERVIGALEELNQVRKAYEASERVRNQSLQMATVLFALLGQTQAQVQELSRRLESLLASPDALSREIDSAHLRLTRATTQEGDLRAQLVRAQAEREHAQALADLAARRIQHLESALGGLDSLAGGAEGKGAGAVVVAQQVSFGSDADGRLDQVDATLRRTREVLDREEEAVQEIAGALGAGRAPQEGTGAVSVRVMGTGAGGDGEATPPEGSGLFGTTPDNGRAVGSAVPVPGGSRMEFVGAAARRISRGMDPDEILLTLCRATAPAFADVVLVYLREPLPVGDEPVRGTVVLRLRRTEGMTGSPAESVPAPGACGNRGFPVCGEPSATAFVDTGGALARVLREVRPVFGGPGNGNVLSELAGEGFGGFSGMRAVLAPLRGRRRVVGIAVFLRRPGRTAFEGDDLQVAAQLATQTALGIDKALLYSREPARAGELQRSMLPESLPQPPGVRLAARYLPTEDTSHVGGDWYDAIPLPGSRVALVIGDVMGHSMASAAIMGQLRTTAQTLAGLDLPPQEVLRHLDEQAQRLGTDHIATCLYAVYDPVAHRITVASAGQPPPVLLSPVGRASVLKIPPNVPIGVGGMDFEAVELAAPAGSTLVLYTDGLVESRLREIWTGVDQLCASLSATTPFTDPPALESVCEGALTTLRPGDRDDDVALLVARFEGLTASDVAQWSIDNDHTAPGTGRRFIREALRRWKLGHLSDTVQLLVSELITNAVNATPTVVEPIEMRLLRTHVLRCEIQDRSTLMPHRLHDQGMQQHGRGLHVVDRLTDRWGVSRLMGGKVVWFEIPIDDAPA